MTCHTLTLSKKSICFPVLSHLGNAGAIAAEQTPLAKSWEIEGISS